MSATYIHTKRKPGFSKILLRILAVIYLAGIIASIVYLWCFTQDRFVTTASFKIAKQEGSGLESGLMALALPGLSDSGSADSQITISYIDSADLLLQLEKDFDLVKHYSSPQQDFVFRLDPSSKLEDRLEYYRKRINANFDKESGLTIISVDTFSPELSHKIAGYLLKKTEAFVNVINQEVADQQLGFIRSEVEHAAERVNSLNQELLTLQNQYKFITPDEVITANLAAVQEMQMERLHAETELASILRDSPGSPRIDALRSRLLSLSDLIDAETAKLSGPERDRLNQVLLQFKELQAKIEFAIRLRTGSEMLLEKNRVVAIAQSRFFSVIQNPYVPENVAIPRRPYTTVTILFLAGLLFMILRALAHSVFERA